MIAVQTDDTTGIDHKKIENFFIEKLDFKKVPEEQRTFKTFDDYLNKKSNRLRITDFKDKDG